MGGGENSSNYLVNQLIAYKSQIKPYEFSYVSELYSVKTWWRIIEQKDNFIQKLALKIFSIIPHNASCERVFSVLGWMCSKRRTK
jgi:hypothetical protein